MVFYKIKFKPRKTVIASARYGHKEFMKGKTYEVRRKLSPEMRKNIRLYSPGAQIISVHKLPLYKRK